MQAVVLGPEGSVANKFYIHKDIFRYQGEVLGALSLRLRRNLKKK